MNIGSTKRNSRELVNTNINGLIVIACFKSSSTSRGSRPRFARRVAHSGKGSISVFGLQEKKLTMAHLKHQKALSDNVCNAEDILGRDLV
jgi:hypothetical protein